MAKRMFTMEEYIEAEELMAGYCLNCGTMRECCEPDASRYHALRGLAVASPDRKLLSADWRAIEGRITDALAVATADIAALRAKGIK